MTNDQTKYISETNSGRAGSSPAKKSSENQLNGKRSSFGHQVISSGKRTASSKKTNNQCVKLNHAQIMFGSEVKHEKHTFLVKTPKAAALINEKRPSLKK